MVLGPPYLAEREIALLVCAERPERLVRDLAAMVSVNFSGCIDASIPEESAVGAPASLAWIAPVT